MSDHFPFIAAIRAAPAEDGPRLVYADYLDSLGDPVSVTHAEYVRLSCLIASRPAGEPGVAEFFLRAEDLRRRFERLWLGPLRKLVGGWEFRRGLVESVSLDADRFVAHADLILAAAPVRQVRLLGARPHLAAVAGCDALGRLDGLFLSANYLGDDGVERLAGSPHLTSLGELHLPVNDVSDRGAAALASGRPFAGLRVLHLGQNVIRAAGVGRLAASANFPALEELYLQENPIGDAGARALAASGWAGRLRVLDVTQSDVRAMAARAFQVGPDTGIDLETLLAGVLVSGDARRQLRERFGAACRF